MNPQTESVKNLDRIEVEAHLQRMRDGIIDELATSHEHGSFVHALAERRYADAYIRADPINRANFDALTTFRESLDAGQS